MVTRPSEAQHPPFQYRPDIDGLRAVAVAAVLIFHAFPSALPSGFVGVDIFFVISGFLISQIISKEINLHCFKISNFYSRRINRIFPALTLILFAVLIYGWFFFIPSDYYKSGQEVVAGATFVSNLMFWHEAGYFDQLPANKPLLHLWSLGVEEQFYIFWPLLLWLSFKRSWNLRRVYTLVFILSFAANVLLLKQNVTATFYSPFTRMWELALGAILTITPPEPISRLWLRVKLKFSAKDFADSFLFCIGVALIGTAFGSSIDSDSFPGWWALLPTLGTGCLIAAGAENRLSEKLLSNRFMVGLGKISFPLYLWHWPLLVFARKYTDTWLKTKELWLILFVSVLLAILTYRLVELPLKKWKSKKKVPLLCLGMICAAMAGQIAVSAHGLVNRFPAQIRPLLEIFEPFEFFHFNSEARSGYCHALGATADPDVVYHQCVEPKRPLIFIWGDSFAASLYPGLKALQKQYSFGIAQYTLGDAPPFFGFDSDTITEDQKKIIVANTKVLAAIQKSKPELVILHWCNTCSHAPDSQTEVLIQLKNTIRQIAKVSAQSKVVVIGQPPIWREELYRNLYRYWLKSPTHQLPPPYTDYGLRKQQYNFDFEKNESQIQKTILPLNAKFLSLREALCNESGCLTRFGNSFSDLTAIDNFHLTARASIYAINRLSEQLMKEVGSVSKVEGTEAAKQ